MRRLVREKRSVFVRMFLLFSIPLALLAAVSFVSYTIYTNQLRNDLFSEYGENLNQLAGRIAVTLEKLNRSVLFLREFDDIAMVLDEVGDARKIDPRVLNRAARALSNYGHTREIVASIWIHFRESGLVLSSGGTASDSFFFGEAHVFDVYNLEFWQQIPFRSSSLPWTAPLPSLMEAERRISSTLPWLPTFPRLILAGPSETLIGRCIG